MCDIPSPAAAEARPELLPRGRDVYLDNLKADWHAVARYRVFVSRYCPLAHRSHDTPVAENLPYAEAKALESAEQARLAADPGYRPNTMGRPLACIELQSSDDTYRAFQRVRADRFAREAPPADPERKAA